MKNNRAIVGFVLLFLLALFSFYQENRDYRANVKHTRTTLERELKVAGMASKQAYAISDALRDVEYALSSRRQTSDFFLLLLIGFLFGFITHDRRDGQPEDETKINPSQAESYIDRSPRPPFPG